MVAGSLQFSTNIINLLGRTLDCWSHIVQPEVFSDATTSSKVEASGLLNYKNVINQKRVQLKYTVLFLLSVCFQFHLSNLFQVVIEHRYGSLRNPRQFSILRVPPHKVLLSWSRARSVTYGRGKYLINLRLHHSYQTSRLHYPLANSFTSAISNFCNSWLCIVHGFIPKTLVF